jgi:cystathionine beta-lyase/cystathionine gamma-synthase
MKALDNRMQNLQSQNAAADLAAGVAAIFEQYPPLCGFSVQERSTVTKDRALVELEGELCLADVSVVTAPAFGVTQEFCNQIAYTLLKLMDEQPDVFDLLSGRTFARILH